MWLSIAFLFVIIKNPRLNSFLGNQNMLRELATQFSFQAFQVLKQRDKMIIQWNYHSISFQQAWYFVS